MTAQDKEEYRRSLDEQFARSGGSTRQGWFSEALQLRRPSRLLEDGLQIVFETTLRKRLGSTRSQPRRRKYNRRRRKWRRLAIRAARELPKHLFSRGTLAEPPWTSLN
jgi:hypothetical protein